jgi:hypothetical protein
MGKLDSLVQPHRVTDEEIVSDPDHGVVVDARKPVGVTSAVLVGALAHALPRRHVAVQVGCESKL